MPKRLVDGEAVWRSDKLSRVEPEEFRAEYTNLLPLALADGTFEANARRVWAEVYSYNRPSVTVALVEQILTEFERVGLLVRKPDASGKIWGKWQGIECFLPPPSLRDRYKNGNPAVFDNIKSTSSSNLHIGLDLDRIGLGQDRTPAAGFLRKEQTPEARVARIWSDKTGKGVEDKALFRKELKQAVKTYGEEPVIQAFEFWAGSQINSTARRPVSVFLRALDDLIAGGAAEPEVATVSQEIVQAVCDQIARLSDNSVIFSSHHLPLISAFIRDFDADAVVMAFRIFWKKYEEGGGNPLWAAKEFTEQGRQILRTSAQQAEEMMVAALQMREQAKKIQQDAEEELAETEAGTRSETELAESEASFFGLDQPQDTPEFATETPKTGG